MPTLGNTHPDLLEEIEAAHRQAGLGIADIVGLRKALGRDSDLLEDVAPGITWEFTPAISE